MGLVEAGFVRSAPAVFVWLGVIAYLTSAAIEYIAGQATPTEVVLDYGQLPAPTEDRAKLRARAERQELITGYADVPSRQRVSLGRT
ncbi:hypothetical protein GCM10023319_77040 [Nocardia iowensis]|uniref:Uncharacterized protein n=1 Tax=Nocardia iowensis TaxID=204891 RepID=A0ABX8RXR0_NOCIO|nr:hypothetical protein KV110_15510 [Nocardia iowensis]